MATALVTIADVTGGIMADEILEYLSSRAHVRATTGLHHRSKTAEDTYLAALGLTRDVTGVIHVAGTKGKGSTCAMADSILRSCGYRTGLFTSPHLHDVRERIQIFGKMVEAERFEQTVIWCHDRLRGVVSEEMPLPNYFHFLMLVAMKLFAEEGLDAVILEVGIGGRFDPTNFIQQPVVCGLTLIGQDHVDLLGETIDAIAWQKGGILKTGVPAYTVEQTALAADELLRCAASVGTCLQTVVPETIDNWDEVQRAHPLTGFQRVNASLAVALCREFERQRHRSEFSAAFLERRGSLEAGVLPEAYLSGLSAFEWKGRAQIVDTPYLPRLDGSYCRCRNVQLYLDGAHTPESLEACVDWIQPEWRKRDSQSLEFLLFGCKQPRDPEHLLTCLHRRLMLRQLFPSYVLFAPLLTERRPLTLLPETLSQEDWLKRQLTVWRALDRSGQPARTAVAWPSLQRTANVKQRHPEVRAAAAVSLMAALDWVAATARSWPTSQVRVLVTGSLYLVSDVLRLIKR